MLTSPPALTDYLGKKIDQICPFSIGKNSSENHCAHFVSHVMEYEFAETCKNYTLADKQAAGKGAAIRVNNIFNVAPGVGPWTDRPLGLTSCLIFVTISGNMTKGAKQPEMKNGTKKHIGIFIDGVVWHYNNSRAGVAKDQEKIFITKFEHNYITAGNTVEFFYGRFLK